MDVWKRGEIGDIRH